MVKSTIDEIASRGFDGMTFDQLNALYDDENDPISTDYDEYFDDMDLTETQKLRRKDSAEKLEDIFKWLLALVFYYYVGGVYDYTEAITETVKQYETLVKNMDGGMSVSEFYLNNHIPTTVMNTVGTMIGHPESTFNFTIDRARIIAENEANSMWNDAEFLEAVRSGKKYKTWRAIIDRETRDWHREANGQTRPIMEPFEVNGEFLQFPLDESLGASGGNLLNCRCTVTYS